MICRYCAVCKKNDKCTAKREEPSGISECYTPQTKFCRYCVNLVAGNGIYCSQTGREMTEKRAKSPNRCKEFCFCAEDALALNDRGYRSRGKRTKEIDGQMSLFDFIEGV